MLKRKTTLTKSKAKNKAWKMFSKYIRRKYEKYDNAVECYTCGKIMLLKEAQAGHGISGRNNAVLFMEEVVRPQCVGCNVFGRGKLAIFTMKLIEELGMKKYKKLVKLANEAVQYKTYQYVEIYEKYKALLLGITVQQVAEEL